MNKKIIVLRIVFTVLLLMTYLLIFLFSSENGQKSSEKSRGMMHSIIVTINGEKEINNGKIKKYEPLLRKLAHFGIYFLSGVWSMCLMCTFFKIDKNKNEKINHDLVKTETIIEKRNDYKRLCISTTIGFLYACSDEIHQLFSLGRSGEFIDVIIDTIGVINGLLCVLLILRLKRLLIAKYE